MEANESSDYVKARVKLLYVYFKAKEWVVSDGKDNKILIYISSDQSFLYSTDELADIIAQSDLHIEPTFLKMSSVTYLLYHRGTFVGKVVVLPGIEFDT
ncbi:hypothetical protein [Pedobacter sp. V48]|uniref:hypothetical protein n=1 Tax=Pedobacter sp. V48 TaxID=509635 RepID=UPI0003E55E62|nr:hypothetical protein [Pedobacter sp. V48]ETZ20149.1 hypothetical protein N824_08020 [Pedobacter sp. V48]